MGLGGVRGWRDLHITMSSPWSPTKLEIFAQASSWGWGIKVATKPLCLLAKPTVSQALVALAKARVMLRRCQGNEAWLRQREQTALAMSTLTIAARGAVWAINEKRQRWKVGCRQPVRGNHSHQDIYIYFLFFLFLFSIPFFLLHSSPLLAPGWVAASNKDKCKSVDLKRQWHRIGDAEGGAGEVGVQQMPRVFSLRQALHSRSAAERHGEGAAKAPASADG